MKKLLLLLFVLVLPGFAQMSSTGQISILGATCAVTNACILLPLFNSPALSTGALTVTVTGTFTGTLQFEASGDNAASWNALPGLPIGGGAAVTSTTTTGTWVFNIPALTNFRVRASAMASPTAVVTIQASGALQNPTAARFGQAIVDTSAFNGADCGTLAAATLATVNGNIITTGSLVAHVPCAVQPINANFRGEIMVGSAIFHLQSSTASWIVPTSVLLRGMGKTASAPAIGNGTVLQACANDNAACAGTTFTSNTPLICFLSCDPAAAVGIGFDSRVEEFTLDCNNIAGCIGGANYFMQENGGYYWDFVMRWGNHGIGIDHGGNHNTAQNSAYEWLDIFLEGGSPTCTSDAVGMRIWGAGPKAVRNITMTASTCAGANQPNDWIQVITDTTVFQSIHFEQWQQDGVALGRVYCFQATMPGCGGVAGQYVGGAASDLTLTNVQGSNNTQGTGALIHIIGGAAQAGGGTASLKGVVVINAAVNAASRPVNLIADDNNLSIATSAGGAGNLVPLYMTNVDKSVNFDGTGSNIAVQGYTSFKSVAALLTNLSRTDVSLTPISSTGSCAPIPANTNALCLTLPAIARKYVGSCNIYYQQTTAAAGDQIGVQFTTAPTTARIWNMQVQVTAATAPTYVATPAAITDNATHSLATYTPGANSTAYFIHWDMSVDNPASATTFEVIQLTVANVIIYGTGSNCQLWPSLS